MLESYARLTPGAFYLFQSDAFGRYSLPAISEQIQAILGFDAGTLSQNPQLFFDRLHPDDRARVHAYIQQSRQDLSSFHCEYRIQHQAGQWVWLASHSEPEQLAGNIILWRGFLYDISAQKNAELQLQQSIQSSIALLNHIMDAVISIDEQGIILSFNRSAELLLGYQESEAVGQNISLIMPEHHAQQHDGYLERYKQHKVAKIVGNTRKLEAQHKDGHLIPIELRVNEIQDSLGKRFLGVLRDLSEQQQQSKLINQLTHRDPLTLLPNRMAFVDELSKISNHFELNTTSYGLYLLNIDNFKQLNSVHGRQFCDRILLKVAKRLQQYSTDATKLARVGGDEFALLIALPNSKATGLKKIACKQARQLLQLYDTPIQWNEKSCLISLSIGVCLIEPSMNSEQSLQYAETAVKYAKQQGKNSYQIFTSELENKHNSESVLAVDLRHAIELDQLEVHLQGQFDVNERLIGAEALLRWQHPTKGQIPPGVFIPLAEESGLIVAIGRWLIEESGKILHRWKHSPQSRDLKLAINISSRQFSDPSFIKDLLNCQMRYQFTASQLHLELTESLLINNAAEVASTMMKLNGRGFTFSLDDFGTGYSSLAYLKHLPLQTLKIDRSFVNDIHVNQNDSLIARSIISLAHNMGLDVIAEGVETKEQLNALRSMGCTCFQGYFFQHPESIETFTKRYLEPEKPKWGLGSVG
ncbi:EAL domain-containing protein [Alkalimonas sp. MEB108]|uniref:EAL domain-containing protein n=1 Tax=Alkalimonas cellulosilytica TaxID=3058395 RepID=A0ABU7J5H8_9GAMM|nr:EAL domain-containing protein [Alkalimonas sp. MEB108]MEE2001754.1 EAL domain-containing protein [Alkalimonas sp. MEB108]